MGAGDAISTTIRSLNTTGLSAGKHNFAAIMQSSKEMFGKWNQGLPNGAGKALPRRTV
jgi:hypothetical protein